MSAAALVVLQRHTWYLTEDCISIALFNPDLEDEEKNKLAQKIGELPTTQLEIRKPTLPTVSARSKITDFVGKHSILLFSLLKMDHKFLLQENWKETDQYDAARKAISNLHPVKARGGGGGGKRHFFSFYICDRAAEDEQVEKNRIKIRPCIPEILHAKV